MATESKAVTLDEDYDVGVNYEDDADVGVVEDEPEAEIKEEKEEEEKDEKTPEKTPENSEAKTPEEKTDDKPVFSDEYIKEQFGLDGVTDLTDTLLDYKALVPEHEELQSKYEALQAQFEKKEPIFKSDFHKKAFDFVTNAPVEDISRFGQYAHLMAIDESKMPEKDVMKEEFVLKRPEMHRARAEQLFEKRFNEKYPDPDDEETKLEIEDESSRARKFISEEKQKYTPAKESKPAETQVDESVVSAAIDTNIKTFEKALQGYQGLKLDVDGAKPEDSFTFVLSKDRESEIKDSMASVLKDKSQYDPKTGTHKSFTSAEQSRDMVIWALYGREITAEYGKHCLALGKEKQAEVIEKTKPDRKPADLGSTGTPKNMDEAWSKAGDKRVTKRVQL